NRIVPAAGRGPPRPPRPIATAALAGNKAHSYGINERARAAREGSGEASMDASGNHGSQWMTEVQPRPYPALAGEREVDVAVVGGGITGLTTALLLAEEGRSVVVLEARRLGSGTTGGTSAHLTAMPDAGFHEIERK